MKRFFYTMFYIILSVSVNGQNIVEQLKTFSQNADMDCYYKMIEKNDNIYFKQEYEHRGYWAYCSNCSSIEILKDSGGYRLASHLVSYLTGIVVVQTSLQHLEKSCFGLLFGHSLLHLPTTSLVWSSQCLLTRKELNLKSFGEQFLSSRLLFHNSFP